MDKKIIEKYINDNGVKNMVLYAKSLTLNDYNMFIDWLINQLINYEIPKESCKRNTVALVLSSLKCNKAVTTIIKLLKNESESKYIGTLVYALQNLECHQYLEQIFHLIYIGNYEVRRNMFDLLEQNKDKISIESSEKMKISLNKAIETYKDVLLGLYIAKEEIFND